MMAEKDRAVDEYKRMEQACQDKWVENPEVVPEECLCTEGLEETSNPAQLSSPPSRFGEDQASLGLDRYSVGYDLPQPANIGSGGGGVGGGDPTARKAAAVVGGAVSRVVDEVSDLIVETLADLTERGEEGGLTAAASKEGGGEGE